MEKIKRSPLENVKTVIIAILTVSMLTLAALYIGGTQFSSNNSAISAHPLPSGAVAVGEDAPIQTELYEKGLIKVSYIGVRYGDIGGGAYGAEQASSSLLSFSLEGIHELLSSDSTLKEASAEEFFEAASSKRYVCLSLHSPIPYQTIYALSGEYTSPVGYEKPISPVVMLLAFDAEGKASLYMRDGENYYVSYGNYTAKPSELLAIASDSRLYDFEILNGIPLSESSPTVLPIKLTNQEIPGGEALENVFALLDYDRSDSQPISTSETHNVVAPHGNLLCAKGRILYNAANEGGISMLDFLTNKKSELDLGLEDILEASVSLTQSLLDTCKTPETATPDIYLDGFYRNDDTYTVILGAITEGIPIKGNAFPYSAKITVQNGKIKGLDLRLVSLQSNGLPFSPFSSAWEYRHAAKSANIHSIGLYYRADTLEAEKIDAAWYFTGERTVEK